MKKIILAVMAIMTIGLLAGMALAVNGAETVTFESSSRAPTPTAGNNSAIAGNVTEITIDSDAITQTWAGYYGNVSGTIQLANSGGDVMYNWSDASPNGEVLASINQTVDWANIACASAANITLLESTYNIGTGVDGIDETFTGTIAGTIIAGTTTGTCSSMQVFDETGASNADFEEILLWDGDAPVFASILEDDALGFDNAAHDFEMLVLEDGHGVDVAETVYYFFVELN